MLLQGLLILFIFLGLWYACHRLTRSIVSASVSNRPDYYAMDVFVQHFSDSGQLYDELHTPFAQHNPVQNTTYLQKPILRLFASADTTWQLSANDGQIEDYRPIVTLWNNVFLIQTLAQQPRVAATQVATSYVVINLSDKTAVTPKPVTFIQPNQIVHAIGMHADFKTKIIHLQHQVRAQLQMNNP